MQISAKIWDYLKNNQNLSPFENSRNISFGISLEPDLIKTLIKILFSSNFGMNIGKILGLFKKIIKFKYFENSKEYKFWDFT